MNTKSSDSNPRYLVNDTVKSRLLQFRDFLGLQTRSFEKSIGVSNGYLKSLRSTPSSTTLEKIYSTYPSLNPVWLITGEGDMLVDDATRRHIASCSSSVVTISSSNIDSANSIAGGDAESSFYKKRVKELEKEIAELKASIASKDKMIDELLSANSAKDRLIEKLAM